MRLHAVGLPHLDPVKETEWCAYSQKIRHLRPMLAAHGHELITYGGPTCDVPLLNEKDRERWFPGRDWSVEVFDQWDPQHPAWTETNLWAHRAIRDRIEPGDAVGIIAGRCQETIADAFFQSHPVLEWGVGYVGVLENTHRCFESKAWRHHVAGLRHNDNHRFYDTVIPNAFDPNELLFGERHDGYALYLGRLTARKGVQIAIDACAEAKIPLVLAGQGNLVDREFTIRGDVNYVGVVTGDRKAELLSKAQCLLAPTTYLEPFGGVAVEAMMSGTPAITTDWGAFTETVEHEWTGWRCSTLGEFTAAIHESCGIDRYYIRSSANGRYSLDAVAPKYDRWFQQIETLAGDGWYSMSPGRLAHS